MAGGIIAMPTSFALPVRQDRVARSVDLVAAARANRERPANLAAQVQSADLSDRDGHAIIIRDPRTVRNLQKKRRVRR